MTLEDIFENGPTIQGNICISLFDGEEKVEDKYFHDADNLSFEAGWLLEYWGDFEVTYMYVGKFGWLHIELQKEKD